MAAASDLVRHRGSAAAARAAVSGRAGAAVAWWRPSGRGRRCPPRPFFLQPALWPLSVPTSAPRHLPEPTSCVPGAPAGRDTKGCVEEGFVRSHEAAQPVSAERGGGAGPPPLPSAEELGSPGPPLGAWGRAGGSGSQVMPRGRGRPGGTAPSLEGGRGHSEGPQASVPCCRPPRRVPQGRLCSAARLPGAGPARAARLCWRPAWERLRCRPGTGGACAPHPPLRSLPFLAWSGQALRRPVSVQRAGESPARRRVPSGSGEVVYNSEGKVTSSGTRVVCSGSQQLQDLVVSLTKFVLPVCSDERHLDKWNGCEM